MLVGVGVVDDVGVGVGVVELFPEPLPVLSKDAGIGGPGKSLL